MFFLLFSVFCQAQNEQLAQNYYDRGDFEKALISYNDLLKAQPSNSFYFQRQTECLQQLSKLDIAEKNILLQLSTYKQSNLLIELGYNFQLKKNSEKAKNYYEEALKTIKENSYNVYAVAVTFEKKVLLEYALKAYQLAFSIDNKFNFNYQMAVLYGQLGNTDAMIESFLTEAQTNPNNAPIIQNQLSKYMNEVGSENFSASLKKSLLLKVQKSQDVFWNQYLSWFFIQQKEYNKAFIQEKAIYKRENESLNNVFNLSELCIQEKETDTAKEILMYILENTNDSEMKVRAQTSLLNLKITNALQTEYSDINTELETLIKSFGNSQQTISLQILQAHFLAFKIGKPDQGKAILKSLLDSQLSRYNEADVKMELADILLFEEKFNQASIYYSQLEEDLKGDEKAHEASLKVAKTTYFKGDFDWALKQFKVLKSASSQLIANDALEYFLLINDNKVADSAQVALKKFARGDYLLYQNKPQEALTAFLSILKENKGNEIESVTLYRLGKTYEKLGDSASALSQYQTIIDKYSDGIYIDEALYFCAEICNKQLKDIEKAKALYEKIILNHQDSIYFVDARQKYRKLRGDKEQVP